MDIGLAQISYSKCGHQTGTDVDITIPLDPLKEGLPRRATRGLWAVPGYEGVRHLQLQAPHLLPQLATAREPPLRGKETGGL